MCTVSQAALRLAKRLVLECRTEVVSEALVAPSYTCTTSSTTSGEERVCASSSVADEKGSFSLPFFFVCFECTDHFTGPPIPFLPPYPRRIASSQIIIMLSSQRRHDWSAMNRAHHPPSGGQLSSPYFFFLLSSCSGVPGR